MTNDLRPLYFIADAAINTAARFCTERSSGITEKGAGISRSAAEKVKAAVLCQLVFLRHREKLRAWFLTGMLQGNDDRLPAFLLFIR
jgi:hypothetical protein